MLSTLPGIAIWEETRAQRLRERMDVTEMRNLGQTSPGHKELWGSSHTEYHFKGPRQVHIP